MLPDVHQSTCYESPLIVGFLNCEGINCSKDFINNFLTLQETWTIDSNINILGNIHNEFLFTGISGVDCWLKFYKVVPKGAFPF